MKTGKEKPIFLYNARLVRDNKPIKNGWILLSGGKIRGVGYGKKIIPPGVLSLNAQGSYLTPGFIDLHIHGEVQTVSRMQVKQGTTGFLCALHAGDIREIAKKISEIKKIKMNGSGCLGFNLEGPFINKNMAGAQPLEFIVLPDAKKTDLLLSNAVKDIKIITLAPELVGGIKLIKKIVSRGIVAAMGHSQATIEEAKQAFASGASYATHVFNRMSGITARNPGLTTEALLNDEVFVEVIADGYHVHPELLRLLIKNKPKDKIVLVTDSVSAMANRNLDLIGGVYRKSDLTIAGSNLTMIQAIKNMVKLCGLDLTDAVRMATLNPAEVLRLASRKGKLAKGYDADLVIFDERFKVRAVLIDGELRFNNLRKISEG